MPDPPQRTATSSTPPSDPALAPTTPSEESGNPTPAEPDLAGAHLGRRYRITRRLGAGGMGAVYLAVDEVLGHDVALKRITRRVNFERLRAEVLLAQKVTHPNVCRTWDLEELDGGYYVKMEYLDGETLAERLAREGWLSVDETVRVARAVCAGLSAAHARGVVHCDLKPHNVLVERGTGRVVLTDFGVARAAAGDARGDAGGTPAYMAPEQVRGQAVDARTDLYGLGAMLFQLLAGKVPFPATDSAESARRQLDDPAPDPRAVRPALPRWIARLVVTLLAKDPSQRPPSAGAVLHLLDAPRRLRVRATVGALLAVTLSVVALATWRASAHPPEWHPRIVPLQPAYEENGTPPRVSPDGRWLAYLSDREGRLGAYVRRSSGGAARALSDRRTWIDQVGWTQDGNVLLWSPNDDTITRKVAPEGGPAVIATRGGYRGAMDCGGRLIYVKVGSPDCPGCSVITEADSGRALLVLPSMVKPHNPVCDRSGRQIAYSSLEDRGVLDQRRSDIYVASFDGTAPRALTSDGAGNDWPTFHPDGRSVVYTSQRDGAANVFEVSAQGGPSLRLTTEGRWTNGDVSPDGSALYVDSGDDAQPLVAHSLASGVTRRITHTVDSLSQPEATADGHSIVALVVRNGRPHVVRVPLDEGEERVLAEGDTVALSRDGREAIYTILDAAREHSRVMAIPVDGSAAPRELGVAPGLALRVFCDGDGWVHLYIRRPVPGAYRVPLAGGAVTLEAGPSIWAVLPSPTGGWRAIVSAPKAHRGLPLIHVVAPGRPLEDATAVVIPHDGLCATWSPDGRALYYWTGTELRRHLVATGVDELVFLEPSFNGMTLSADGKTVYVAEDEHRTHHQVLTNFADHPRPPLH